MNSLWKCFLVHSCSHPLQSRSLPGNEYFLISAGLYDEQQPGTFPKTFCNILWIPNHLLSSNKIMHKFSCYLSLLPHCVHSLFPTCNRYFNTKPTLHTRRPQLTPHRITEPYGNILFDFARKRSYGYLPPTGKFDVVRFVWMFAPGLLVA